MVSSLVKQEAEDKKVSFHGERGVSVPCPLCLGFLSREGTAPATAAVTGLPPWV